MTIVLTLLVHATCGHAAAKDVTETDTLVTGDDFVVPEQIWEASDSLGNFIAEFDDIISFEKPRRDWSTWRPSAKRAMWLAIVLPGAGQIYNRKYWKLPIIYGGFMGCFYAIRWNNMMYRDYSQAYKDIMDDNPETQSYNQFMHLGRTIDSSNIDAYQNKFRRRKDYYRRYRDLSMFILIGVYAISVIDAYVDASLSEFDISPDLSMRISPAVMQNGSFSTGSLKSAAVGVQCSLNF